MCCIVLPKLYQHWNMHVWLHNKSEDDREGENWQNQWITLKFRHRLHSGSFPNFVFFPNHKLNTMTTCAAMCDIVVLPCTAHYRYLIITSKVDHHQEIKLFNRHADFIHSYINDCYIASWSCPLFDAKETTLQYQQCDSWYWLRVHRFVGIWAQFRLVNLCQAIPSDCCMRLKLI